MSQLVGTQRSGVVATDLIYACTKRSGAVVLTYDDVWICGKSSLEIRTYRGHEYHEQVFRSRMHTYLRRHSNQQRTYIKSGTALISRDIILVEADNLGHHFLKQFSRHFRHKYAAASALQTRGVLVHAEHTHLAVRTAVGLQPLKSFLTVMQACGRHVHLDVLV